MSIQIKSKFRFKVLKSGSGWMWVLLSPNRLILASGEDVYATAAKARHAAQAFRHAITSAPLEVVV